MPEQSIQRQEFQQKKPFLIAAMFTLVAIVFAVAWFHGKVVSIKQDTLDELRARVQPLMAKQATIRSAQNELNAVKRQTDKVVELVEARRYWAELVNELRRVVMEAETKTRQKLDVDVGLWVESFGPTVYVPETSQSPDGSPVPVPGAETGDVTMYDPMAMNPGVFEEGQSLDGGVPTESEVTAVAFVCRGVDRESVAPTANTDLAFALQAELAASQFFGKEGLRLQPIVKEDGSLTFSFGVTAKLKKPFKLKYGLD